MAFICENVRKQEDKSACLKIVLERHSWWKEILAVQVPFLCHMKKIRAEWVSPRSKANYHIRFLSHTTSQVPFLFYVLFLWQCALLSFASLKKIVIVKKTAIDGFKIKKMCFWCPIGNYGNTWPDATLAPPLGTNFNYGSSFYRKLICFRFF